MLSGFDALAQGALQGGIALEVMAASHGTAQDLAARQSQRLAGLLQVAVERSRWYRRRLRGVDVATCRLDQLPA
jgi:hypothetical protein